MALRRTSLLIPCSRLDDFPTRLDTSDAAELLSAWTTLWHPALIHATGGMPGWHPADDPPEPETLAGELVLVPSVSRERLAVDWHDRVVAANPDGPPPLNSLPSRKATISAALEAASLSSDRIDAALTGDFLALGYAHLQVELMTRAMRYTSVLDADAFRNAVLDAATAAVVGEVEQARDGLARAFDLLTDARNHFYSVDFYLVDVTLLAESTLGNVLRGKLADGPPTNLLGPVSLLEQMAREHPETLAKLRKAVESGQACMMAGPKRGAALEQRGPEDMLAELQYSRQALRQYLGQDSEIFAQFGASYSPLLPEILRGLGIRAALYAAFDGQRCERPAQLKSRWGEPGGATVDILAAVPLDVSAAGTWLALGERIADTLIRDHIATLLLAGWPGQTAEYYDDLRRIAAYGPVLGKFVTLDDYFRLTAEVDDWTSFHPQAYALQKSTAAKANPISSAIADYRQRVEETFDQLAAGLTAIVQSDDSRKSDVSGQTVLLNPWSFDGPRCVEVDPLKRVPESEFLFSPELPGCGFGVAATAEPGQAEPSVPLVEGRTLRNEFLELVVSEATGGIQSLRTHRDRSTRVSQRLVMHDRYLRRESSAGDAGDDESKLDVEMFAERIEITRNDALAGEITSHGQILDADRQLLAGYSQTMRLVRGLPAVLVYVRLAVELQPEGDIWSSYFASRLAWREEAVSFRHGVDSTARPTGRSRIDSPEWVEISDASGSITCFGLGLRYHRLAGPTWLDTLLSAKGETADCFNFAIGLNCKYPTQTALSLLTAGRPSSTKLPSVAADSGWFFHVSAKHVIVTHLEPLPPPRGGVRLRLLEIDGLAVRTSLTAYRPFQKAQRTDFRGEAIEKLTVADGRVKFEIAPFGWLQIEAEW